MVTNAKFLAGKISLFIQRIFRFIDTEFMDKFLVSRLSESILNAIKFGTRPCYP